MKSKVIKMSDIARCPTHRMDPGHFRDDGTCLCVPEATECTCEAEYLTSPESLPTWHQIKCPIRVAWETTGTWVIVELCTGVDYGEDGAHEYKTLGEEVYGPFPSKAAADAAAIKMNSDRGYYTYNGRKYRYGLRDFDVFRLTTPEGSS